jgi:hypothetical protein
MTHNTYKKKNLEKIAVSIIGENTKTGRNIGKNIIKTI